MTLKKVSRLMPIDPPSKEHAPKRLDPATSACTSREDGAIRPPSSSGSARATARSMAAQADDGTSFRTS